MVNYKLKYLEMKLKYINAKNKKKLGGSLNPISYVHEEYWAYNLIKFPSAELPQTDQNLDLISKLCYGSMYDMPEDIMEEITLNTNDIFIMKYYDDLIGFFIVENEGISPLSDCFSQRQNYIYIKLICIHGKYRGQGHFRKFFTKLCDYYRNQGKKYIYLTSSHEQVTMYMKIGFKKSPNSKVNLPIEEDPCGYKLVFYL
jgi:GNAT superfamily N-acetyltransferase